MFYYKDDFDSDKLNQNEIEEMRRKRLKENKAKKAICDILVYSCFIWVQFIVAYSKTDSNAFNYRARLIDLILYNNNSYPNVNITFFVLFCMI
jgi:hypothetical protein